MATTHDPPTFHRDSPSPEIAPTRAMTTVPELSRCLSSASLASHGSATTDNSHPRESLGTASDVSNLSRHSSASFLSSRRSDVSSLSLSSSNRSCSSSRFSTMSVDRPAGPSAKRRGYMRPTGTDFAASARHRESVLSLGSIIHLQYYFARTGLLDGKGGQLSRRRNQKAHTLDFSQLDSSSFLPGQPLVLKAGSDVDSSYASMGSSPDHVGQPGFLVESPIQEAHSPDNIDDVYDEDEIEYLDDFEEMEPPMLPPTASTYIHREKPVVKPPSMTELRAELTSALDTASKAVDEVKTGTDVTAEQVPEPKEGDKSTPKKNSPGWFQVQGLHILDVMTLAIRAAKVYYTSHDHPDRLDSIKPEKAVRAELLSVMEALKRMASRNFAGGIKDDEMQLMDAWLVGLRDMLRREGEAVAAELAEVAKWTWLRDADWADDMESRVKREYAFIQSLLAGGGGFLGQATGAASPISGGTPLATTPTSSTFPANATKPPSATLTAGLGDETLPPWTPIDRTAPLESQTLPTPFLRAMQNGLLLVRLHNGAVRKSQRRFGAIASYHVDTQKPYRCADNLRYWAKAAELRWEVQLRGVDALAIVYDNSGPQVWLNFEDAILTWCRKVREEIAAELATSGLV